MRAPHLLSDPTEAECKFTMDGGPGPEVVINGRRYLYFGGTGYFSFQTHPEIVQTAQAGLADFGMCTASSRSIFGTSPLLLQVEQKARDFFGSKDAIYLPSGYLINVAGFQALVKLNRFDAMFVDELAHWSITDFIYAVQKSVFTFAHGDAEDLDRKLKSNLQPGQRPLVASDGVFPTFGDIAPLPAYFDLVELYDGCIWMDDCHAVGVLGENGRGTCEYYGMRSDRVYFGGTLSKAVGAYGGIIPGTGEFVQAIRSGHIANGANPCLSAAAAAAVKGLELMMSLPDLRQQLWRNARRLKSGLTALGFSQDDTPVPVAAWALRTSEDMDRVHAALMERGIAIQRMHYVGTSPKGLLRAVVFANHTPEQIDRMLNELRSLV